MREINGPGELYIVQTPHCIDSHPTVYKTGRAWDSQERLRGYPKGTKLLCCLPVSRMRDGESAMLGSCRGDARLEERKDFGSEYFEGDLMYMVNKLGMVAGLFTCTFAIVKEQAVQDVEPKVPIDVPLEVEAFVAMEVDEAAAPSALDATLLLEDFIRSNLDELSQAPVCCGDLLDRVTAMLKSAGCKKKATPTLKGMMHDLRRYFGADELMTYQFPDGKVRHAIRFPRFTPDNVLHVSALQEFLAMEDNLRGCTIERENGAVTTMTDFKALFETPKKGIRVPYVGDIGVFQAHGFLVSPARVNTCRSCKKLARTNCCAEAGRNNKIMKTVIYNMQLFPMFGPPTQS